MSTVFGINKNKLDIELIDDCLPDGFTDEDFIEIAFRGNYSGFRWKNDLGEFLPNDLKVYPLDNSAQGIYTIGDIKYEMMTPEEKRLKKLNSL